MAKVIYDANIYIRYKRQLVPHSFYMSAVVLQELLAGAADSANVKELVFFKSCRLNLLLCRNVFSG